ncbi:protein REGULATOR OF FATTY ACID COMPOSITION 3, chloroplastic [Lolium perenne]|uniref:protein REGULATOR OF FATTY ACID COMPOSITION 3, chloroplastic n=1 Tax=Lolium perenne TaxID=4522 RepID=UPI0021EAF822|nr:protein REGULATOR OF FATTY ACID COMPOSITION 3, chloroplastic [Lolium perenne]
MEATAGSSRTLFLLTPSPPLVSTVRLAVAVGRRRLVAAGARKRRGKDGDAGEERVDSHSFNPKAGEVTGPFPESVLLRKKKVKEDGEDSPEFADAEEEKLYELLNIQLESGLNLQRMRHYEVVYLIHEDRVEEAEDVISKVQEFVRERKGRIWRVNNWGLRRLAYKIKKATHANYVLMNFEIQAKCINDFKTLLDKDERIIRHLVMKRDEAITEDCPPPPEFHAMRSQQLDDEYIDEEYAKADDGDDEGEDGNVDDDVEADDEPEIILVDEVDDDNAEDLRRRNRKIKLEKYTMGKVLR